MWFAWCILPILLVASNRWLAHKGDRQQYVHSFIGLLILLVTVTCEMILVVKYGFYFTEKIHNTIGFIALLFVLMVVNGGLMTYRTKQANSWENTRKVLLIKAVHRSAGYALILLANVNVFLGTYNFTTNFKAVEGLFWVAPAQFGVVVSIVLFMEINYRFMKKGEDEFEITPNHPTITEKEFDARIENGEKLWILDELVLDVSQYVHQHPGGAFLLNHTVGRDISKFFYGGYALDGNNSDPKQRNTRNTHSNQARKVLNRHIVGVL
jgi:hypothetical protein